MPTHGAVCQLPDDASDLKEATETEVSSTEAVDAQLFWGFGRVVAHTTKDENESTNG